jgi:hypothetical protein
MGRSGGGDKWFPREADASLRMERSCLSAGESSEAQVTFLLTHGVTSVYLCMGHPGWEPAHQMFLGSLPPL